MQTAPTGTWDFHVVGLSVALLDQGEGETLSAHRERASALHGVLQSGLGDLTVGWGEVDEVLPRRLVELTLTVRPPYGIPASSTSGQLEAVLVRVGVDAPVARLIATYSELLIQEQVKRRLGAFEFHCGNGTRARCLPGGSVTVVPVGVPPAGPALA